MRAFFLLLCCLPFLARAQSPDSTLLARGDALRAAFDNAAALSVYDSLANAYPDDFEVLTRLVQAHNDLAEDLLAEGDKKAAEEHFEQAVALAEQFRDRFPDRPEPYFFLAASYGNLALFKGGKSKVRIGRAVESYAKRAIELDSTYALGYLALGIFYREVAGLSWIQRTFAKVLFGGVPGGSREDAVRYLTRAVALDPTLARAHYELALTVGGMDRKAEALPHLERVLTLAPFTSQDVRNRERARELLTAWRR